MTFKFVATAAISVLLLSMGTVLEARPKVVAQLPVDDGFVVEDFVRWSGDESGLGYVAAYSMRVKEGVYVFCGAGHYATAGRLRRATRQVLRNMRLKADGEIVLSDLTYFNTVSEPEFEAGTTANCASTGVKVTDKEVDWSIDSSRSRYSLG